MPSQHAVVVCPVCHRLNEAAPVQTASPTRPSLCSHCNEPLSAGLPAFGNPFPFTFLPKILGGVARLLIKTGALDALERQAEKSETELDDLAVRITRWILEGAASL